MAPRTKLIAERKHILDTQQAPDEEWEKEFTATEKREHLPPGLLRAVALSESGWDDKAESPAGAYGLMQFMPDTAKDFNVDRTSAISSIKGAGHYLRQLIDRYGGDVGLALSAYNGGPGNVDRWLKTGHWNWNRKENRWNARPKENKDYAHIILGTMGYDYSNDIASPMLGAKQFVPNAKGKNAPYIMPDGSTSTSSDSSNLNFTDYFLQSQKPNLSGTYQFRDIDPSLIPQTMQEQPEINPETVTASTFYNPLDFNNINRFSLAYQPQTQQQAFSFVPESPLFQGAETAHIQVQCLVSRLS